MWFYGVEEVLCVEVGDDCFVCVEVVEVVILFGVVVVDFCVEC